MIKIILMSFFIIITVYAKPHVYVTILPQKFFIQKISQDKINIRTMLENDDSYDHFKPTQKQLNTMPYIVGYFTMSLEGEKKYHELMQKQNRKMKFFDMMDGLYQKEIPYIWFDPIYVKEIASNILKSVVELDGKNKELYERNYHDFLDELDRLYIDVKYRLQYTKNESFFIFDDTLKPFYDRFELKPTKIEFTKNYITLQEKRKLQNMVKENNIKTILVTKSKDYDKAKLIAKAVNIPVIYINPISFNWLANIYNITNELAK